MTTDTPLPNSLVWEVPPKTTSVKVTIYNSDKSWKAEYEISNLIDIEPGQFVKVEAQQ